MKKFLTILALVALTVPGSVAQSTKLGHIDRQALMLMLPERKDAETKMQAFAKTLEERLKAMRTEYQTKLEKANADAATMTNTEKEVVMRELQELEGRIVDAQEKAQEDLQKQEQELLAPMVERTNKAISEVAAAGNFTYIFDTSTGMVLYYDKGEDILPAVKAKLGIQ
jgi:outer membrane protein